MGSRQYASIAVAVCALHAVPCVRVLLHACPAPAVFNHMLGSMFVGKQQSFDGTGMSDVHCCTAPPRWHLTGGGGFVLGKLVSPLFPHAPMRTLRGRRVCVFPLEVSAAPALLGHCYLVFINTAKGSGSLESGHVFLAATCS